MITNAHFKKYALAFPEVEETPHMDKKAYRVKKKIFVTHNAAEHRCCVKLSQEEQDLFCLMDKEMIYPVPNTWGRQGWTLVNLKKVNKEILTETLKAAYCHVAPRKLADAVLADDTE